MPVACALPSSNSPIPNVYVVSFGATMFALTVSAFADIGVAANAPNASNPACFLFLLILIIIIPLHINLNHHYSSTYLLFIHFTM